MSCDKKQVLAFDFGASSGRAILGTLKDGKIHMEEVYRFSNDPVIIGKTMYWDTLRQFFEIKQGIIKAKQKGESTLGGLTSDCLMNMEYCLRAPCIIGMTEL